MHVGLDSRNPGPQNDFDRWIPSFDKGPRRIEHRYLLGYMLKTAKNKCKLGNSRLRGWLIGPFIHSLGSCLEQLKVCMEKPDTFPTEKTFLLNR